MELPATMLDVCEVRATRDLHEVRVAAEGGDGTVAHYIPGELTYEAQFSRGGYAKLTRAEFERLAKMLAGDDVE